MSTKNEAEAFVERALSEWRTPQSKEELQRLLIEQVLAKLDCIANNTVWKEKPVSGTYTFIDDRKYGG